MSRGVLIIRAEQEQSVLELKLRERGFNAYCHSMVDINALTPSDTDKENWLETLWDGIVVVSPNAARFFELVVDQGNWPKANKHYFAVGPGTGEPLLSLAKQPVTWPTLEHNSNALLQLPELLNVSNEQWLIINGAPGRSIIPDTLIERGASVTIASVYERVPKQNAAAAIPTTWFEQIDRILVSSREQAELITAYFQQEKKSDWAKSCQWVVPSERIAEVLHNFGIPSAHIHFATSAMADDLVAATIRIKTVTPMSDKIVKQPAKKTSKSRFWSKFFIFVLLLSVLTLGAGGWYLWQQQNAMVSATEQEFDALRSRLSEAQRTDAEFEARLTARLQQEAATRIARQGKEQQELLQDLRSQQETQQTRLRQQVAQQEQDLMRLSQRVRASESRNTNGWLLSEAYDRVNIAVQRLSIDGDPTVALNLLNVAKEILLDDSASYQTIIDQIERDIDMIAAVPAVDYTGVLLLLQDMQRQVKSLPLHFDNRDVAGNQETEISADVTDWRDNLANAWKAFSEDLVRIQRDADLPLRLNQEQRLALNSRLELQLQLAQQALNRHQQDVFSSTLMEVSHLVNSYFVLDDPKTTQFLAALDSIRHLNVVTEFPTSLLSRAMLRERLRDLESKPQRTTEGSHD
ncbi:MAG TPA: uroporphyrinogen-III C-methyltransferase [Aliidiomarina sp.]|nr:uroporphyrinogen-III C-methyltransferase [Aliidiomarina sp.]